MGEFSRNRKKGGGLSIQFIPVVPFLSLEFLTLILLFGSFSCSGTREAVIPDQDQDPNQGVEIALRALVSGMERERIIKNREDILDPAEEEPAEYFRPGEIVTLICDGYGNHSAPDISWTVTANIKPKRKNWLVNVNETDNHNSSRIFLPVIRSGVAGLYTCTAKNKNKNKDSTGEISATVRIHVENPVSVIWVSVTTIGSLALIALLTALIIYIIRVRNLKQKLRDLSQEEVEQFIFGDTAVDPNDPHAPIYALPFDRNLEVPPNSISMDEKSALGAGEFGVVRLGELKSTTFAVPQTEAFQTINLESESETEPPSPLPVPVPAPNPVPVTITVAVKLPKFDVSTEYFKSFLREIKLICYAQNHENIVKVLAASTINIKIRRALVVLEYCGLGNLENYLKRDNIRGMFKNEFKQPSVVQVTCVSDGYAPIPEIYLLETLDLLNFSLGVANGVKFLAEKKVVHGDLACRNVLLTNNREVKIADFGMSTKLKDSKEYTKATPVVLPWRLSSLEVLLTQSFSEKSDVWSFGILLHEIFSFCEDPYPGFDRLEPKFVQTLQRGTRPGKPEFANKELFDLMKDCWQEDPKLRPTFAKICDRILEIGSPMAVAKLNAVQYKSIQWFH